MRSQRELPGPGDRFKNLSASPLLRSLQRWETTPRIPAPVSPQTHLAGAVNIIMTAVVVRMVRDLSKRAAITVVRIRQRPLVRSIWADS